MSTEPMETLFDGLREAIPAPQRQSVNRAAFLARAESESAAIRHSSVEGGHMQLTTHTGIDETKGTPMSSRTTRRPIYFLRLAAVALIGCAAAFAVSPQLRTLAQEIIALLQRAPDTGQTTVVLYGANTQVTEDVRLSFEDAMTGVPFPLKAPSAMPDVYTPYSGHFYADIHAFRHDYRCDEYWGLALYQSPLDTENLWRPTVADSAAVIDTTVNGVPAQYAQGYWVTDLPQGVTGRFEANYHWDSSAPFYRLTWEADGMTYALVTSATPGDADTSIGACALDMPLLVRIAESLQ